MRRFLHDNEHEFEADIIVFGAFQWSSIDNNYRHIHIPGRKKDYTDNESYLYRVDKEIGKFQQFWFMINNRPVKGRLQIRKKKKIQNSLYACDIKSLCKEKKWSKMNIVSNSKDKDPIVIDWLPFEWIDSIYKVLKYLKLIAWFGRKCSF